MSMSRSFGESIDPVVFTLAAFCFEEADVEACLHMQADPQVRHFAAGVVRLPSCNLKLHMTLEVSDLQDIVPGATDARVVLDLRLESYKRHSRRDRGEYAIIARALPHIGTERQVDIRLTQSVFANGAQSGESQPYYVSDNCWTHSSLRNCDPLFFFIAIWKADLGYCFNDFLIPETALDI